jgi:Uma2 family endonuclease
MSPSTGAPAAPTAPAKPSRGGIVPFRLTVGQFLRMIDAGILTDRDRVELLGGILVAKMVKHTPHNFASRGLSEALRRLIPADWLISEEKAIILGPHWRPEPDLAVIRGPNERYRAQDPQAGDIAMIVEVADSTYAKDRGVKWRRYAACGVAVYWIVNIPARIVEVYTDPAGRGRSASYRGARSYGPGDEIPVTIDGREVGRIAARDILP